jgi:cyclophilin family peptidyl-prolyl cis-trans isomerase
LPVTTLDPGPTTTVDQNTTSTTEGPTTTVAEEFVYGSGACAAADGSSEIPDTLTAPQKCIEDGKGYVATVVTSRGTLEITLNSELAPGNVNNFVTLARYGYYDGTDCHRIIKDFVVQCGRRNDDETQPGYTVADELPSTNPYYEGVVAMANTGSPDSAGGQFFIVTGQNGATLPASYTILGQVTKGYSSTVKLMEDLADPLAENGVPPLIEITIESVTIEELDEVPTTTVPTTTTTTTTIPGDTTPDTATDGTSDVPTETDESTPATGTEAATSTT